MRTRLRRAVSLALACLLLNPVIAAAERLRIATFNAELVRNGPALLLRDIESGKDAQVEAVLDVIASIAPDVLALQGFDWDYDGRALAAFARRLAQRGPDYPHLFAPPSNRGLASGLDLDGDGRTGQAQDAQGFGAFTGQGAMAVLSRFPIDRAGAQDFTDLLWQDLPGHIMPTFPDGTPFPSPEARDVQRLSSSGHWSVPIQLPGGQSLTLLTFHASPPVFDGSEDRNGRRNHDELTFWLAFLDGRVGVPPGARFVLAGAATLDPMDSDGRHDAIRMLLTDPRLQDPRPTSIGAAQASDQGHLGENALDTVDWDRPGRLRVDYVLPSADLTVLEAGVYWPAPGTSGHASTITASRHRLVWVDIALPVER